MVIVSKITGMAEIIGNLKRIKKAMGRGAERGAKKAGLFLQRESMKEVPVDTGNLRGSAFTRKVKGSGFDAIIGVGYTASYAIYVHENTDALHGEAYNQAYGQKKVDSEGNESYEKLRGQGQKSKFLEDPLKRNRLVFIKMIKEEIEMGILGS